MLEPIFQRADAVIRESRHPLLVSHRNPDGDTLGGMLAFGGYLDSIGKEHTRFCVDRPAPGYAFMPGIEKVISDGEEVRRREPDAVVVFDAGDLKRAAIEELLGSLPARPKIVNFDHHASNTKFGDVNVLMTDAASTTEVVHHFLSAVGVKVNRDIATCILTGLCTDTSNFSNPATSAAALKLGGELLASGGKFSDVQRHVVKNKTVPLMRLWGIALERLRYNQSHQIAVTALTLKDFEGCGVDEEGTEGISNFLAAVLNAPTIMVLRESPGGFVRGSLRTVEERDVSKLAIALGGGGHKKAAGFTVRGRLIEKDGSWFVEQA